MRKTIAYVLLLSVCVITPTFPNYFHNPITHLNLNIGSAPNPTPADLRAIGDSSYAFDGRTDSRPGNSNRNELGSMTGKEVSDMAGDNLGVIVATDDLEKVVLLQTPTGSHIVISGQLLSNEEPKIVALTITPMRLAEMAQGQKGQVVVYRDGHWGP